RFPSSRHTSLSLSRNFSCSLQLFKSPPTPMTLEPLLEPSDALVLAERTAGISAAAQQQNTFRLVHDRVHIALSLDAAGPRPKLAVEQFSFILRQPEVRPRARPCIVPRRRRHPRPARILLDISQRATQT